MPDTAPLPLPCSAPSNRRARARRRRRVGTLVVIGATFALVVVFIVSIAWTSGANGGPRGIVASVGGDRGAGLPLDPAATGEAGGVVLDGTTAFDVDVPAVAGLDPHLLDALQRATRDAAADGVPVVVNSGWRSAAYQNQLLHRAVAQYGTPQEAARWVATPTTSEHVKGDAVDIGSWDATAWFSKHGAAYDLCQIYMNETWHYELRDGASTEGCPPMYRDPTYDPRMQQ